MPRFGFWLLTFIICLNEFIHTTWLSYQLPAQDSSFLGLWKNSSHFEFSFFKYNFKYFTGHFFFPVARMISLFYASSHSRRFFVSLLTLFSEFYLPFGSFFITKHFFLSSLRFPCTLLQKYNITSKNTFFFVVFLYQKHFFDKVSAYSLWWLRFMRTFTKPFLF